MVKTICFVAFGNSLTVGFIPSTFAENQPYSRFLKTLADDFLERCGGREAVEIRIRNKGVTGELTSDMLLRFHRDVINLNPDYVILLGGTNDIGWGFSVKETVMNLRRMFERAKDFGIEPIGCTIPSILGWDAGIPPRLKLNQSLNQLCRELGFVCVDLFTATSDPGTQRLRARFSSDGLHLNAAGYRTIAETIFEEAVRDVLTRELNILGETTLGGEKHE